MTSRMMPIAKPKLGVFKFASCDGCQLSLLDCEDELLAVAGAVDIANFPEASRAVEEGPYDLSLVEGSITTPHDAERIKEVRAQSKFLISIGACATAGGIQALRNWDDVEEYTRMVYATPEYISTLDRSTPISDHIEVDFELRGCPISKASCSRWWLRFCRVDVPTSPPTACASSASARGTPCVMVAQGTPCLGPVTQAGCGCDLSGLRPGLLRVFRTHGISQHRSLGRWWEQELEVPAKDLVAAFRGFNAYAEAFRNASDEYESRESHD